jgi:hypothetical protein
MERTLRKALLGAASALEAASISADTTITPTIPRGILVRLFKAADREQLMEALKAKDIPYRKTGQDLIIMNTDEFAITKARLGKEVCLCIGGEIVSTLKWNEIEFQAIAK